MRLRPCEGCRRHVAVDEARCPFCGHALAPVAMGLLVPRGRFSRAAVFAGATLAGACWTGSTTPRETPIEHKQVESKPSVPPPGTIRGVVHNADGGAPLPGVTVTVQKPDGSPVYATTNAKGEYEFKNLPPGQYAVMFQSGNPNETPQGTPVTLESDAGATADVFIDLTIPDRAPCCKPYGAPPARRRIV
ncbi:MAG TPA: carboxypeptidase-like regulatory domain-containing protein [Kofleriaceae bacterium]|nr:carboxypeptidase-like regulatory domain-containing protein [Kofleriaceae bacterium]